MHEVIDAGSAGTKEPQLIEIADGAYAWIGVNGDSNAGVVVGHDGLIVIDAQQSERQGMLFRQHIETTLRRPSHMLINTHFHLDHTAGNAAFANIPIHAHDLTRRLLSTYLGESDAGEWRLRDQDTKLKLFFGANIRELVQPGSPQEDWFLSRVSGPDHDAMRLTAPTASVPDIWVQDLPDDQLTSYYWGPAHCDGDLVLTLERGRIAFVGDLLFVGRFPWLGDCDLDGWIARLGQILKLDIDTVVPGHGPVVSLREASAFRDLLCVFRDRVADSISRGMSEEDMLAGFYLDRYAHLPRYKEWASFNARSAYRYFKAR